MRKSIVLCAFSCIAACQPHGASAPAADAQAAASHAAKAEVANPLQFAVDGALRTRRLQPSRFEDKEPAPGDSFVVLDVSVRNPGRDTRVFNAGPLVVVAGGREHRFDTPENIIADGYLLLEALKPGSSVHGRIVYEVPVDLDGAMYWLPGNGQRLPVQPSSAPLVAGARRAQEKTPQAATARVSPAPPASTVQIPMRASTAQSPASASASASTAATADVAAASPPLRELACRALESDRHLAAEARYRDFFRTHCKGGGAQAPMRTARAAPAEPARADDIVRRDVAAEPAGHPARVVPSDSGPSFDCAQAVGRAEQLVCADALLSLLDRQLAQAVSEAERKVTDPTALLRDQDDWRARVRDACRTLDCLEHVYTQRTAGLRAIGGFAEVR
jgi:hypothetical protein